MGTYNHDPNAPPDPTCKACQDHWPIHVDKETGKRGHIEILRGIWADCPTDKWIEWEEEDETSVD